MHVIHVREIHIFPSQKKFQAFFPFSIFFEETTNFMFIVANYYLLKDMHKACNFIEENVWPSGKIWKNSRKIMQFGFYYVKLVNNDK